MASATYRIEDEPTPGGMAKLTVNPFWPLLALMLAGGWLAWPWFVVNALAMGSSTRRKEIVVLAAGVVGLALASMALAALAASGGLPKPIIPYVVNVAFPITKLAIGYVVYAKQVRSFQLFQHFGGTVKSGMM